MFGIEVTQQALFYGVVFGLIYAVFAAGFVLVYRCTGVLNLAQGGSERSGSRCSLFHVQYESRTGSRSRSRRSRPRSSAWSSRMTVVRRLFSGPRLVLLIATVGVAQLLLFCA